jgi:hypothetical protein
MAASRRAASGVGRGGEGRLRKELISEDVQVAVVVAKGKVP